MSLLFGFLCLLLGADLDFLVTLRVDFDLVLALLTLGLRLVGLVARLRLTLFISISGFMKVSSSSLAGSFITFSSAACASI